MFDPLRLRLVGHDTGCDEIPFFIGQVRVNEPFFCEVFVRLAAENLVLHRRNIGKVRKNTKSILFLNFSYETIHFPLLK